MRKLFTILAMALVSLSFSAKAQKVAGWEIGIQAEYGRDWYHKSYAADVNYGEEDLDFSSDRSSGGGIYFEKSLNPRWSVMGQVGYAQKKVHPQLFHYPSQTTAHYYTRELHHRVAADAGLRLYLNPESQFKFFVDGKIGGNAFISIVQREARDGDRVIKDVFGFQRVAPVSSASVGFKWSRLTVSAEYRDDLMVSKRSDKRSGISGKGLFGKVGVTLFEGKSR
ncbi:outer membrane beta-barrel protein [Dyadobacter sp. Leaf189]|uniref:outer membrane beta-barrel protein n=1 Tax=Dyadobacter sp. Leaf189 TaxID=1736295 RepID=UPI0006F94EC6|nr:outer membrane beta-barrel protein [Dyadobacter sp. Leaf189]KQS33163.1 hypothetical protein ASG33_03500 [Dyadobacter sp. Leaf189]